MQKKQFNLTATHLGQIWRTEKGWIFTPWLFPGYFLICNIKALDIFMAMWYKKKVRGAFCSPPCIPLSWTSSGVRSVVLPPLSHPYMNVKVKMSSWSLPSSHSSYSSHFLSTSCFSPPSSSVTLPIPLHLIQSLPLFLIYTSLICEGHGERKSLSHQSCTYFVMV